MRNYFLNPVQSLKTKRPRAFTLGLNLIKLIFSNFKLSIKVRLMHHGKQYHDGCQQLRLHHQR